MVCFIPSAATVFEILSFFSPNEEYEKEDDSTTPKTPPRRERLYRKKAKHSEYGFQKNTNKISSESKE